MIFHCSGFCLVGRGLLQCYTAVLGMPEGSSYSQTLQVYQVKYLTCIWRFSLNPVDSECLVITSVFATVQFQTPETVL